MGGAVGDGKGRWRFASVLAPAAGLLWAAGAHLSDPSPTLAMSATPLACRVGQTTPRPPALPLVPPLCPSPLLALLFLDWATIP